MNVLMILPLTQVVTCTRWWMGARRGRWEGSLGREGDRRSGDDDRARHKVKFEYLTVAKKRERIPARLHALSFDHLSPPRGSPRLPTQAAQRRSLQRVRGVLAFFRLAETDTVQYKQTFSGCERDGKTLPTKPRGSPPNPRAREASARDVGQLSTCKRSRLSWL